MARVSVEDLCKFFGEVKAVDHVSVEIKDGEFLTLLGPSGCGKTTLLRLIAGLEVPTSGRLLIGEKDVSESPPRDRNIAMVFQSYALYPHMNVLENIGYSLKIRKVPKAEIHRRVQEVSAMLGIEQLLARKPKELSGGQRQRVALGRAIIRQPEVFLMDEPLSNLDAKLRLQMRVELVRLQKDLGTTLVYVTHDQIEAMTMSDRIVVMQHGQVQQVGSPRTIYNHPANTFVAGFVGSPGINFFDCTWCQDGSSAAVSFAGFRFLVPATHLPASGTQPKGSQVIMGIRPEDIAVGHVPTTTSLPAKIYLTELIGNATIVTLEAASQTVRALAGAEFRGELGETVYLEMNPKRARFFDKSSGVALSGAPPEEMESEPQLISRN